ncbi:lipase family protein [Aeromicrobium sp.]|uniref:lipase family protein n=1 Tax=Aeromicrobium sp. TaxID=1871063 RepID=UPI0030C3005A
MIGSLLLKGWAVSVPDYEGIRSEFLVAGTEGKAVLDGIRALDGFAPAGLQKSPKALWGYSGGSLASAAAAQLQPSYAPEVKLAGVALGGLLGDVREVIDAFSGSFAGGGIPMGINGFLRAYPELDLLQYINESGRQKVKATEADCLFESVPRYPFLTLGQIEATPDALSTPAVAQMLAENSPRSMPGAPSAPVYHYHAKLDEFAPIGPARDTIANYCRAGTIVESREKILGEHLTELALGAPGAVGFLDRRFAGKTPINTCRTVVR